jgi:hypothetical protein
VDTSSLVISSFKALNINGSTFFAIFVDEVGTGYLLSPAISFAALFANTRLSKRELLASLFLP